MDKEKDKLDESAMISGIIVEIECLSILFLRWLGNTEMIVAYSSMKIVLCATIFILTELRR